MNASLPFRSTLADYERMANSLFAALQARDEDAAWRFKWVHPRFREKTVTDVHPEELDVDDARMVVARENCFGTWDDLTAFISRLSEVADFEIAADAIVNGDIETLRSLLRAHPDLVRARSTRAHHCTLLHYIGANGVEGIRQKTPPNAVEITRLLLDSGADVDALADLYDARHTTMTMLVSSCHPAQAGLQVALAETLLDYGAAPDVLTALTFGYLDTAKALARRGAAVDDLLIAAGLGLLEDTHRLLSQADGAVRHAALALAAQLGHADVVELLLEAGEDPNRFNPKGFHAHSTPLHQAVSSNRIDMVRLLVRRGARRDIRDTIYDGTPLDWAQHLGRTEIAAFLLSS